MSNEYFYLAPVHEVAKALESLPESYTVSGNAVNNLAVFDENKNYIGFIAVRSTVEVNLFDNKT